MSDSVPTRGRGPVGTDANSPVLDKGTTAKLLNRPSAPENSKPDFMHPGDFFSEVLYYPITATGAKIIRKAVEWGAGDEQGNQLLELWLSGTAPDEVTLDDDSWGDYMRKEPNLQKEIQNQLKQDAYSFINRFKMGTKKIEFDYEASFHGEVGEKAGYVKYGGYFTGYQILHGSKKTDTLKDVQILAKVTVEWKGAAPLPYTVTYKDLQFMWDDIINVNPKYKMDKILANYSRWEKEFTSGGPPPKDYSVHIKWKGTDPVTFSVNTSAPPKAAP